MERSAALRQIEEIASRKPDSALAALDQFVVAPPGDAAAAAQGPPATQEQLAAWCLAHPAPGMRVNTVPEPGDDKIERDGTQACLAIVWTTAPANLGIDADEEVLATFSGQMADRHPPTSRQSEEGRALPGGREGVRLLTWGDPLLVAWLEAVRGDALTLSDHEAAGIAEGTDPFTPG
jgi:hypothetical protein